MTAERRSTIFFCFFSDLFDGEEEDGGDDDDDDDEEEARRSLEPPLWATAIAAKGEFSAVELRSNDDDDIALARRIVMAQSVSGSAEFPRFWGSVLQNEDAWTRFFFFFFFFFFVAQWRLGFFHVFMYKRATYLLP